MYTPEFFEQFLSALTEINKPLSLEQTAEAIASNAAKLYQAKGATVFLYSPINDSLKAAAACGLSQAYLAKGPVSASTGLKETILGEPVVVPDVSVAPNVQYREEAIKEGIKCIVGVPITAGRLCVGALRLYFPETRYLEPTEFTALKGLAVQAGLALRKNIFFASLKEFSTTVHETTTIDSFKKAMDKLVRVAVRSAQAKAGALYLFNRVTNNLEAVSAYGLSTKYLAKGPLAARSSLGEVIEGIPIVVTDVATDPRLQYPQQAVGENIKAIVGFPLKTGNKVLGALRFYFPFIFEPDQEDMTWMEHVASQICMAVERKQLLIQMKASRDHYLELIENIDPLRFM